MAGCICYFLIMSSGCRQTPCPASDASTFEQYCLRTAPFGWQFCGASSYYVHSDIRVNNTSQNMGSGREGIGGFCSDHRHFP
ncbi:hypothetical protein EDD16DRAFT_1685913 [Pisolithus croceorrhizus]|nr:hypothetical protein EDD16DRAFT_1685913 [Pisolithus croceorrhizus]